MRLEENQTRRRPSTCLEEPEHVARLQARQFLELVREFRKHAPIRPRVGNHQQ